LPSATITARTARSPLRPLHSLLLSFPVALFPCAFLTDVTYLKTSQIQWTNFSAWLIVGALIPGGLALLWDLLALWRGRAARRPRRLASPLLLAAAWIAGLLNAFQHSHDGWASVGMPGLVLSAVSAALALAAGWTAWSRSGDTAVGAVR